jgi:hypothetical protein
MQLNIFGIAPRSLRHSARRGNTSFILPPPRLSPRLAALRPARRLCYASQSWINSEARFERVQNLVTQAGTIVKLDELIAKFTRNHFAGRIRAVRQSLDSTKETKSRIAGYPLLLVSP